MIEGAGGREGSSKRSNLPLWYTHVFVVIVWRDIPLIMYIPFWETSYFRIRLAFTFLFTLRLCVFGFWYLAGGWTTRV